MTKEQLSKILEILKEGNQENYFINNQGLAHLGGLLLYPKAGQEQRSQDLRETLRKALPDTYKDIVESLQRYHLTSYYTPQQLIHHQISMLASNGFYPKRILEPSAGNGGYVRALRESFPQAEITALEPDLLSFSILEANTKNYHNVTALNTTFEEYYREHGEEGFDLVMTNIPFGDIPIRSAHRHDYIHDTVLKDVGNYFNFFAPRMTRPGGITSILTSKNFVDKSTYGELRASILQNNDLIWASRFNNELFKGEGTKVVSDLLVYQKTNYKDSLKPYEKDFADTSLVSISGTDLEINTYLHSRPDQINGSLQLGTFHQHKDITVVADTTPLANFCDRQLALLAESGPKIKPLIKLETPIIKEAPKPTDPVNGSLAGQRTPTVSLDSTKTASSLQPLTLHGDGTQQYTYLFTNSFNFAPDGTLQYYVSPERKKPVEKRIYELASDYAHLRNDIVLLEANARLGRYDESRIKERFADIDYKLTNFNFKWQGIAPVLRHINSDTFIERTRNLLEVKVNGQILANPEFGIDHFLSLLQNAPTKAQAITSIASEQTTVQAPKDYASPLEMAQALFDTTGEIDIEAISRQFSLSESEILERALQNREFFIEPDAENGYRAVPYFQFASGDIETKIEIMGHRPMPYGLDPKKGIAVLESHRNPRLPIEDIKFNFESNFVPKGAKEAFLSELLKEPVKVHNAQFDSATTLIFSQEFNHEAHERFSIVVNGKNKRGYKKLLTNFAENKYPAIYRTIKDSDGREISVLDATATVMAQNKFEELQLLFEAYILGEDKVCRQIEDRYYRDYLSEVNIRTEAGWLTFPNTLSKRPYDHQIDATLFSLSRGTALLDHKVGKGKTMAMAMVAYKLQQHGRSDRTLLLTLKDIAPQLEKEIRGDFPQLRIHRLTSDQLSPKNLSQTLGYLQSNTEINLIIAEHTHLQKLPKEELFVKAILQEKIDMIELDLETAKQYGAKASKQMVKGLIKRKETLEGKLERTLDKLEEKQRSDITLSKLGIDSLIIDEAHSFKNISYTTRHQNVSGLNQSKEQNKNLDLEISIRSIHQRAGEDTNVFFASGTPILNSVTELYAYQRYLVPYGLAKKNISNFDAWASIFLKQTAAIEPDTFGRPKLNSRFRYFTNMPELSKMYHSFSHIVDDKTFATHSLELDQQFITLEASEKYKKLGELTTDFVKNSNQEKLFKIPFYDKDQMKAATVIALGINRTMLIDPLSQPNINIPFTEADQYKIHQLCSDVAELYHKTSEHKGTMLIFSDLNVWKKEGYNSYDTIKDILEKEHGIPRSEIRFMQEEKAQSKGSKLQEDLRNGTVRIAIGSTQTLGTGTNVQQRLVGVFHLDIPYSPDKFEQRLGRALRAGNRIAPLYGNKIINRMYGIKDTADIFSYSLNMHKQKFIVQLKEADPTVRTYDDAIPMDNELSYAQMQAALIGDMDAFKLVKLESDLKFLETQKKLFDYTKAGSHQKIERIEKYNKELISQIGHMQALLGKMPDLSKTKEMEANSNSYKTLLAPLLHDFIQKGGAPIPPLASKDPLEIFKSLNTLILSNASGFPINKNRTTVLPLPNYNAAFIFSREYQAHLKSYSFSFGLQVDKVIMENRSQQKYDPSTVANQLVRAMEALPKHIEEKKSFLSYNLNQLESNRENVKIGFPKDKMEKIASLTKEIKQIKRARAQKGI